MLRAMTRALSASTSSLRSRFTALAVLLTLASFATMGCNKDKKGDADAAADADVDTGAPAAAVDAAADAAVANAADASDATTAALPTATAIVGRPKPVAVDPPICGAARKARDRNSPAAPGLAAQCAAAGGKL